MPHRWTAVMLILAAVSQSNAEEKTFKNYEIVVDGKVMDLNLDEEIEIKTKNGETVKVKVRKKPFTMYSDKFISFQHKSDTSFSSQKLDAGISQLMSATAVGTLTMVQEYSSLNPSPLVGMMIAELTKEEVDYGYKMTQKRVSKKLNSGQTVTGVRATMRLREEEKYYEVWSYGKKDQGILIITLLDKDNVEAEKAIHDRFWKTLKLKF